MNQEKRKQAGQVIILVVLLVVLGASLIFMLKSVSKVAGGGARSSAPPVAEVAIDSTAPAVAAQAGVETAGVETEDTGVPPAAKTLPSGFNPNVFKVYSLNPPKNPFVQEEKWYTEELSALPGYPELRDEGYFEQMNSAIPEFDGLLGDDESWQRISMTKTQADKEYTVKGVSADGSIETSINLTGPSGSMVNVEWTPASGIPLSALRAPGWERDYVSAADTIPDDLSTGQDLFQPPGLAGAVPVLNGTGDGSAGGEILLCQGISGEGAEATALIIHNDSVRIVQAGNSLPPNYVVEAVTADGVILTDLRKDETKWLPITGSKRGVQGGAE